MEQDVGTAPAESPGPDPKEPILVIGKKGDFFYPVPTVAYAIEYVGRYLASDGMGEKNATMIQTGRLTVEELDFFDGVGRHLTPVFDGGKLANLIVMPDAQWLREHIRYLLDVTEKRVRSLAATLDQSPKMPSDSLSFDDFLSQIVNEPLLAFDPGQNCNWWARVWGRCR